MTHNKYLFVCLFLCFIGLLFADPPELYQLTEQIFEEDGELVVDFVADSLVIDNDGDELIITIVNNVHIQAAENGCVVHFTADENWNGTETLTFFADDQNGGFVMGELYFTVLPVDDVPVFNLPDSFSFEEGEILTINMNDYVQEVDGEILSLSFSGNENISINILGDLIVMISAEDWFGMETVSFYVTDGITTVSDSVTISVVLGNWNHAPEMMLPAEFSLNEDSSLMVDFSNYVWDLDDDQMILVTEYSPNITILIEDLDVTFIPAQDWYGSEDIDFTVYDTCNNRLSASDVAQVIVLPVNDVPVIDLPAAFSFEEGNMLTVSFADYIFDVDGDELFISWSGNEQIEISIILGYIVTFEAMPEFTGIEEVSFAVTDDQGASATDMVEIEVIPSQWNHTPVMDLPDLISMDEDTQYQVDFSPYIYDPDGDDFVLIADNVANLDFFINGLEVVIIPDVNWFGSTNINFTVYDTNRRASATDMITLEVIPQNDPPTLNLPDNFSFTQAEALYEDFNEFMDDIDNDDPMILPPAGNQNIYITIDNDTGIVVFWLVNDYWFGSETVYFTVRDDSMATATDSVLVTVYQGNYPPIIMLPELFYFAEDTELTVDFVNSGCIYDFDDDEMMLSVAGNNYIIVNIIGTNVTLSAPANWFGTEPLTFIVLDEYMQIAYDTVDVQVTPVNDAPVIILPRDLMFSNTLIADFAEFIYDVDGDELDLSVTGNVNVTVEISEYLVTFGVIDNWIGLETLTFTVNDNQGRATATDSVTVISYQGSVNYPPQIYLPPLFFFAEDTELTLDFVNSGFIYDPDDDEMTLLVEANNYIIVDIIGTYVTLSAPANWFGSETLTFFVFDESMQVASDNVVVQVLPVNDAPVIILPRELMFSNTLTADFAECIYDVDGDELDLSVAGNVNVTVAISEYLVTFGVIDNWIGMETLTFTVNDNQGRATASDSINIIAYQSQGIEISKEMLPGWNWLSLNLSNPNMETDNVLASLGDTGNYIKNFTVFATYYEGIGWLGTLNEIDATSMYMLEMGTEATWEFTGFPFNLSLIEYNLMPGWNWISYAPQEPEEVNYALVNLDDNASSIKNQSCFANYYTDIGWIGSLDELYPLDGYKLYAEDPCCFNYPLPTEISGNQTNITNEIVMISRGFDPHKYEFNGTFVIASRDEFPEQSSLVACTDLEIRSTCQLLDYTDILGRRFYALMIYSNEEFEEGCQLFYQENTTSELISLDYTFVFESDMILGDFMNPVMITLPQTDNDDILEYTNKLSVYPNPFNPLTNIQFELSEDSNVSLEIYNLKGQKIETLCNGAMEDGKHSLIWNAQNQSSGIYMLHYQTDETTNIQKLILLK